MEEIMKVKVLFVCSHNSARSQMAEAFLNRTGGDFIAESAGIEAGTLNPFAVEVMKEAGIDISGNKTKNVFEFYKQGKTYNYVVTVCDSKTAEKCPLFPGTLKYLHWDLDDPASFQGTHEEKLEKTRFVRDRIKEKVSELVGEVKKLVS
jgi:arsenate reductase (thioredoxin)